MSELQARVEELEIRLSFQEQLLDTLNQQLSQQQLTVLTLEKHIAQLLEAVRSMPALASGAGTGHEPPPHY